MSDKEAVLELVKRLPATVSLREILRDIEFIAAPHIHPNRQHLPQN
jgi:hypothetical protein